jgi:hypothetical protein
MSTFSLSVTVIECLIVSLSVGLSLFDCCLVCLWRASIDASRVSQPRWMSGMYACSLPIFQQTQSYTMCVLLHPVSLCAHCECMAGLARGARPSQHRLHPPRGPVPGEISCRAALLPRHATALCLAHRACELGRLSLPRSARKHWHILRLPQLVHEPRTAEHGRVQHDAVAAGCWCVLTPQPTVPVFLTRRRCWLSKSGLSPGRLDFKRERSPERTGYALDEAYKHFQRIVHQVGGPPSRLSVCARECSCECSMVGTLVRQRPSSSQPASMHRTVTRRARIIGPSSRTRARTRAQQQVPATLSRSL